jgi:hypothetical protein
MVVVVMADTDVLVVVVLVVALHADDWEAASEGGPGG